MSFPRLSSWLTLAALLAAVAGSLGWLFFGFAGDHRGRSLLLPLPSGAGADVAHLRDATQLLTLAEVQALPAEAWQRPLGHTLGVDRHRGATWCRITLRNPTPSAVGGTLAIGYFFVDRVDCWVGEPSPGGEGLAEAGGVAWRASLAGEAASSTAGAEWGREPAFVLEVPARGERVVYLRLQDYFGGTVRLEWWPRSSAFQEARAKGLLAEGVYFGVLLALLGYNLTLWLRLRFVDTGYYVLYLAMVLGFVFFARGHAGVFGWALPSPGLEIVLVTITALAGVFLAQFARVFLELPARLPRGDRVVGWLRLALGLVAVGALTIPWTSYVLWMGLAAAGTVLTHGALLGLAMLAWRTGARQARFFGLSFGCLFAGTLPLAIAWGSTADAPEGGLQGVMIGSALEMVLLSLALADRFIQAQNDKAAAQRKLVEETERRQALQETYADELADEVADRTCELEAANADKDRMLTAIGHDLRSPLAGLTQRADQLAGKAVPGPALARFAGDVAQTGRHMLLMIEDIVLWARLRTGAPPATAAHAVTGLVTPVVALHRPLAERRGVELVMNVPADLSVRTDLVLAQTLVRNLVGNAVKFARSRVEVSARALPETGAVGITVCDDGPGLPAAAGARLRGESDEAGGAPSGMGLRLTQEIGVTLGAKLDVRVRAGGAGGAGTAGAGGRDHRGSGTEITVTLPEGGGASAGPTARTGGAT